MATTCVITTPIHIQHLTHRNDLKMLVVCLDEFVLHSGWFAKYTAAFFRISRFSVVRFSALFSLAISSFKLAISSLSGCCNCFSASAFQRYKLLSVMPSRLATSTVLWPRSVICLSASVLNSAVYLVPLIYYSPVQFRHYWMSTKFWEVHKVCRNVLEGLVLNST